MDIAYKTKKSEQEVHSLIESVSKPDADLKTNIDIYNRWASTYDEDLTSDSVDYKPSWRLVAKKAADILDKQSKILDVCAGTGIVGEHMTKLGFTNLDAHDGSEGMLQVAKGKGIYKDTVCCFIGAEYKMPIESGVYDNIVMTGCIVPGHVSGDALPELLRIIKPGGRIIICFRELYLQDPVFKDNFEGELYRMAASGKCTILERQVVDNYYQKEKGVIFVVQK